MGKIAIALAALLAAGAVAASEGPLVEYDAENPALKRAGERLAALAPSLRTKPIVLSSEFDPELGEQGYRIAVGPERIVVAGGDARGVFFGAGALLSRLKAGESVDGEQTAKPQWTRRYAGDYTMYSLEALHSLADMGYSGFAWQYRGNWNEFVPDRKLRDSHPAHPATVGQGLAVVSEIVRNGIVDIMLIVHIYADAKEQALNCADDAMVDRFSERLLPAVEAGVKHVMVCADDWTKRNAAGAYICTFPEEEKRFGGSIGRAHGHLMKRVAERLWRERPGLELSFCPAVYSLKDHRADRPGPHARYLTDWAAEAPRDVRLVWTGPKIWNTGPMTEDDVRAFRKLAPDHGLLCWDNSEADVWPRWRGGFYPGAADAHDGMIFINAHAVGWSESAVFMRNAAEYLWNADGYDVDAAFPRAAAGVWGEADAGRVDAISRLIEEYKQLPPMRITRQAEILDRIEALNGQMEKAPTRRVASFVEDNRKKIGAEIPEVRIPRAPGRVTLDGTLDEKEWKDALKLTLVNEKNGFVSVMADRDALYLGFALQRNRDLAPVAKTGEPPEHTRDYVSISLMAENGRQADFRANVAGDISQSEPLAAADWRCASRWSGSNWWYYVEARIPFASLKKAGLEFPSGAAGRRMWAKVERVVDNWHRYGWSPGKEFPGVFSVEEFSK